MVYPIVAMKDAKIGFGAPMTKYNIEVALRDFRGTVKASPFGEDLSLYKIGEFDEKTGLITPVTQEPELLERGENYAKGDI